MLQNKIILTQSCNYLRSTKMSAKSNKVKRKGQWVARLITRHWWPYMEVLILKVTVFQTNNLRVSALYARRNERLANVWIVTLSCAKTVASTTFRTIDSSIIWLKSTGKCYSSKLQNNQKNRGTYPQIKLTKKIRKLTYYCQEALGTPNESCFQAIKKTKKLIKHSSKEQQISPNNHP
jgi:hypothetical protein